MKNGGGKALDVPVARLVRLALHLGAGRPLTSAMIRERFGVSHATAKRDLTLLECLLPVVVEQAHERAPKMLRLEPSKADFLPLLRVSAS